MAPGPEDEQRGIAFPLIDGKRSTTRTGTRVLAAAAEPVSPDLARAIAGERDWRSRYVEHVRRLVEVEVQAGAGAAAAVPAAGLAEVQRRFVYTHEDQDLPLDDLTALPAEELGTLELRGTGRPRDLVVPYAGRELRGDDLRRQLETWVATGMVESSFAEAVTAVLDHPEWLDLSDLQMAVIGAGAEMGPLASLAGWGATVLPIDLPRPAVWERILRTVRDGPGRALVPVRAPVDEDASDAQIAAVAGANVLTDAPAIARWLAAAPGPLTLGNYVYADGGDFVRVAVAVDAVTRHLLQARSDVSLAVLVTPTDVYAVPSDVVGGARSTHTDGTGPLRKLAHGITGGRLFAPNYPDTTATPEGVRLGLADSLITQQGPNYALAKRLQRWRMRQARHEGVLASVNVAPATRTRSVTKNRILAAAYEAAPRYGVEVFEPGTSNTLMAAMLVHDLRNPKSVANPDVPVHHPVALFSEGAAHGGFWRNAYAPRSVLPLAAVRGLLPGGR